MDKLISNISRFFFYIFILSIALGALFGFVCSNGILTVNYNPDNARRAIQRTSENAVKNGVAFVESFKPNAQNHEIDGIYYIVNSNSNSNFDSNPFYALIIHKIQIGETLYEIGSKYNINWKVIMKLNRLSNPNSLKPGDEILIPVRRNLEN